MSKEVKALNKARYTARDFDTLFDDVKQYLEDRYGTVYNDFQTTSQGVMLMDMMAHSLSQLHWYMDRRASESYLDTCKLMSSASKLTRQLGYRMAPSASSSGTLSVAAKEAPALDIPIPVGFRFAGPNGLVFEATTEATLPAGSTTAQSVSVREGQTYRLSSTSDGTAGQSILMPAADNVTTFVINGSVEAYVDGVLWIEKDFMEFGENNQYEVHYHEEPPQVRFGDNISGKVPDSSASIRIIYAVNQGEAGNAGAGTIVSPVAPLTYRFATTAITVTNAVATSGGANPETIEEARRNAPLWFGSRKHAVTQSDYKVLAGTFTSAEYGAIAAANAFVARTVEEDLESIGYINAIEGEIATYQTSLSDLTVLAESDVSDATADIASVISEAATIVTKCGTGVSNSTSNVTNANTLSAQATFLSSVDATLGRVVANDGTWAFDIDEVIARFTALGETSYVNDLTNNWKPELTSAQTIVQGVKSSVDSNASTIRTNSGSAAVLFGQISTTSDPTGTLGLAAAGVVADLTSIGVGLTSISDAVSLHTTKIANQFILLENHLTSILGADCKTNVITVPVLSFNADGDYQSPSQALMNELERYLQGISDVAHVVNVVSGEINLVSVNIEMHLQQSDAYAFSEVTSDIKALVVDEMKKREFGKDLYLNVVYALAESVVGVQDLDVSFSATATYLDTAGNVIIPDSKVLVLGTFSILPMS